MWYFLCRDYEAGMTRIPCLSSVNEHHTHTHEWAGAVIQAMFLVVAPARILMIPALHNADPHCRSPTHQGTQPVNCVRGSNPREARSIRFHPRPSRPFSSVTSCQLYHSYSNMAPNPQAAAEQCSKACVSHCFHSSSCSISEWGQHQAHANVAAGRAAL